MAALSPENAAISVPEKAPICNSERAGICVGVNEEANFVTIAGVNAAFEKSNADIALADNLEIAAGLNATILVIPIEVTWSAVRYAAAAALIPPTWAEDNAAARSFVTPSLTITPRPWIPRADMPPICVELKYPNWVAERADN